MTPAELASQLSQGAVAFQDVMQVIDAHYDFTPTQFQNGNQVNEADTNNGSCKIFAFAKLNGLDEQATLNAFGDFYTQDVLKHPDGKNHANIRNFMQSGWGGIAFADSPLRDKIQ